MFYGSITPPLVLWRQGLHDGAGIHIAVDSASGQALGQVDYNPTAVRAILDASGQTKMNLVGLIQVEAEKLDLRAFMGPFWVEHRLLVTQLLEGASGAGHCPNQLKDLSL